MAVGSTFDRLGRLIVDCLVDWVDLGGLESIWVGWWSILSILIQHVGLSPASVRCKETYVRTRWGEMEVGRLGRLGRLIVDLDRLFVNDC